MVPEGVYRAPREASRTPHPRYPRIGSVPANVPLRDASIPLSSEGGLDVRIPALALELCLLEPGLRPGTSRAPPGLVL